MMEDWTDIIGEELENIEEPLPADDWSVLQQKYAAAQKRKKAAAFAWAGGITSVAAAVALVLLLVGPDASSDITGPSGDINDFVAETLPPVEEVVPVDTIALETPADRKTATPFAIEEKANDEVLIAESEEIFDVIRDTTSLSDKLLADASTTSKKTDDKEEYFQTGGFGFEDFPEEEPGRKRRLISIGVSGSTSDSPILKVFDVMEPEYDMVPNLPPYDEPEFENSGDIFNPGDVFEPEAPDDSTHSETPEPTMARMRRQGSHSDSYRHEIPVSAGVSARIHLTDRLSINTGLNYTRYKSLRTRTFAGSSTRQKDWQNVHYLGVPVRVDYMSVNRKHFNMYFGAGAQMDKCVYATVGEERLHEKQVLFGVNGTMGIQVNLARFVGLYFEPEVSYALNEGTIETFRSDEPFVVTVRGGLRFNF